MGSNQTEVLVSGAGFAGLATAFWMRRLGHRVTIVERGRELKRGGTPVDIRDETIAIAERMGILDAIRSRSLPPHSTEFAGADGAIVARMDAEPDGTGYEIHRDDLLAVLFDLVKNDVEVLFDTSITELTQRPDAVRATFRDGSARDFAMVLGCDGLHSVVRRLCFGPEAGFSRFLHNYFTVAILDETLIPPATTRIRSTPGRTVMVNSYASTTDVVLTFHSDHEIAYDYHDVDEQKRLVREQFVTAGPEVVELVDKAMDADNFYFDKLAQIRMPHWSSGRIALVGDAGYCASPAAGMGGSLALLGAAALFDGFMAAGPDGAISAAFAEYERALRPTVERIHDEAETVGVPTFFPDTEEAIAARNAHLSMI